mgnify:CR=1 FL=1
MQGADHELRVELLLLDRRLGPVDRKRTPRATGVVAPPAPPFLLLSHGEEFEERVRLASEAVARIDSYVELLCLEAVDRVVVEYFDVSVGWVQQQQKQLEQQQPEQQQQLEQQQQQRQEPLLFWSRCALQRRFPVGQATATATAMEQVRKRKRDRERRPEVKQRRKEQYRKRRAEVHAVRSCCHAACVRRRAALVGVAGGVLACRKT